jgi:hypothetical protein
MRYYKDNDKNVYAYDDKQVANGLASGKIAITEDEMRELTYIEPVINPKSEGEVYIINDIEYQVPFMSDDAVGVMQVKSAFEMGIESTNIHFSNGTIMPIEQSNFLEFAEWFVAKRNSFFV